MKKILLVCSAGMSTSMLMNVMRKYAAEINYDCSVDAKPVGTVETTGKDADIILLGPQIRFNLSKVQKMFPDKPVEAIDPALYGAMNGEAIINHIKEVIGE